MPPSYSSASQANSPGRRRRAAPPGQMYYACRSPTDGALHGRMRRAVGVIPGRFAPPRNDKAARSPPARIVRAFARDRHVMDVAFTQAGAGDAHELRLVVEFGEIARAHITHRRAQAACKLMHDVGDRTLVGHLALDAFGHQ